MTPNSKNECVLAIVVLAYNNMDLLEKLLPKIILHSLVDGHQIYVVDNGSSDGTQEYIQKNFPQIKFIRIEVNKGFTNGYVTALAKIKAKYYALVSSDIEVTKNWTLPILDLFSKSETIAAIQPKIKAYKNRSHFEYAGASGGYIDKHGYPFCRGRIFGTVEEDIDQYNSVEEIFWASGACFFIRASVYHRLGGLDDDFYAHMEEIDLCWRIRNSGYKILVHPSSVVYHIGGAVINYGSAEKVYRNHRNNLILLLKNLPVTELWKLLLRWPMDLLAFTKLIFEGNVKGGISIFKAHLAFLSYLPKGIKQRKKVQAMVVKHDKSCIFPRSIVLRYYMKKEFTFNLLKFVLPEVNFNNIPKQRFENYQSK